MPDLREIGLRSGAGSPLLRLGYLKTFMDGTLGSQTAWMSDGSGVTITSGGELEQIVRGLESGMVSNTLDFILKALYQTPHKLS